MTSEAKAALRSTIRGLRARLLKDLHNSTQSAAALSKISPLLLSKTLPPLVRANTVPYAPIIPETKPIKN